VEHLAEQAVGPAVEQAADRVAEQTVGLAVEQPADRAAEQRPHCFEAGSRTSPGCDLRRSRVM
jgi:hypothetical protein